MFPHIFITMDCEKEFNNTFVICEKKVLLNGTQQPLTEGMLANECLHTWIFINEQCWKLVKFEDEGQKVCSVISQYNYTMDHYITSWTLLQEVDITVRMRASNKTMYLVLNETAMPFAEQKTWHTTELNKTVIGGYILCESTPIPRQLICKNNQYTCTDGSCIHGHYHCDGINDCADGSDEQMCNNLCTGHSHCFSNCQGTNCTCSEVHFQCSGGGCVSLSVVCDGVSQCLDNSDEILCIQAPDFTSNSIDTHTWESGCPGGWSLCSSYGFECYPNHMICIFEKDVMSGSKILY